MRYYDLSMTKGKFLGVPVNFSILPSMKNGEAYNLIGGINIPMEGVKHGDKTRHGWLMIMEELNEHLIVPIKISNGGRAYKTKSGLLKAIEKLTHKK